MWSAGSEDDCSARDAFGVAARNPELASPAPVYRTPSGNLFSEPSYFIPKRVLISFRAFLRAVS